jgi:hypothetical protein
MARAHHARPARTERGTDAQCTSATKDLVRPSASNGGPYSDKVFTDSCTEVR